MKFASAVVAATALLFGTTAATAQPTQVVFTVDVESNATYELPGQIAATCTDGSACGLTDIVRRLRDHDWAGTFFLNVYEESRWGEPAMRKLATDLEAAGQDVALHTHPHWAYDQDRWAMYQYTLDEQTRIVKDGVRLLESWTGKPVVAHRAGAYTADPNTLVALERNGVRLDSSWFWQYPECRLGPLNLRRNFPSRSGGVLEIPVTVFEQQLRPAMVAKAVAPVTAVRKIDPDWFADVNEMNAAFDAIVDAQVPYLVVFLHSYSLMGDRAADGRPAADTHAVGILDALVQRVADERLPVVSMREIAAETADLSVTAHADVVPGVEGTIDFPRYAVRRWRAEPVRTAGVGATALFAIGAIAAIFWRRSAT